MPLSPDHSTITSQKPNDDGPWQLKTRYRAAIGGGVAVQRWKGTEAALLTFAFQAYKVGGKYVPPKLGYVNSVTIEPMDDDSPFYILEAEIPLGNVPLISGQASPLAATPIVTLYDLEASYEQRSIWLLPKVVNELLKITDPAVRAGFVQLVTQAANSPAVIDTVTNPSTATVTLPNWTKAITDFVTKNNLQAVDLKVISGLWLELGKNADTMRVDFPSLVRTQNGPTTAIFQTPDPQNVPIRTSTLLRTNPGMPPTHQQYLKQVLGNGYWFAMAPDLRNPQLGQVSVSQAYNYVDSYSNYIYDSAPL